MSKDVVSYKHSFNKKIVCVGMVLTKFFLKHIFIKENNQSALHNSMSKQSANFCWNKSQWLSLLEMNIMCMDFLISVTFLDGGRLFQNGHCSSLLFSARKANL